MLKDEMEKKIYLKNFSKKKIKRMIIKLIGKKTNGG